MYDFTADKVLLVNINNMNYIERIWRLMSPSYDAKVAGAGGTIPILRDDTDVFLLLV